jgi:hypothetical protein
MAPDREGGKTKKCILPGYRENICPTGIWDRVWEALSNL